MLKHYAALWLAITVWLHALPAFVNEAIARSGIPKKDISLLIRTVDGVTVASLNAGVSRVPASVVKVFTTYAAVRKFGFDYRFPTRFFIDGNIRGGVLYGDLYVKGYGDPTLGEKDLPEIVEQIRKHGIVRIEGDIVIDRSYFATSTRNSAHFDENPYSPYNAMPDALMFNERVSTVCVEPGTQKVRKAIPDKSYEVRNELQYVNRACKGRYAWPYVQVKEQGDRTQVRLWGKLSRRCKTRKVCRVVTQPYKSFYYALRDALEKEGIAVSGTLRLKTLPSQAKPLFTHYSDTLETIVAKTAKKSNNLYARQLFLALGARMFGAPATLEKARKALRLTLQADGVDTAGLYVDNGSGLSRKSRVRAVNLVSLLDVAYRRYGERWMRTLSIAGKDGTIRRRFRGTVVAGRAWMKTGTLKRVKNIAGYVLSKRGVLYETVILVNTRKSRFKAAKLQNDIIEALVRRTSGTRTKRPVTLGKQTRAKASEGGETLVQLGTFRQCPSASFYLPLQRMHLGYTFRRQEEECKVYAGPFASTAEAYRRLESIKHAYPGAFVVR